MDIEKFALLAGWQDEQVFPCVDNGLLGSQATFEMYPRDVLNFSETKYMDKYGVCIFTSSEMGQMPQHHNRAFMHYSKVKIIPAFAD